MKPPKLHAALLGGLFIGVVSALPIVGSANGCCCLWLVVGGMLAAYVMQQNHPWPVSLGDGASVGLLAGLFGVIVMAMVLPIVAALHLGPSDLGGGFGNLGDSGMRPEVSEMLRRMDPRLIAAAQGLIFVGVGLAASLVGGALGAVLFRRAAPPPEPPYGPPSGPPPAPSWGAPAATFAPDPFVPPVPPAPPPPPESKDPSS